MVSTIMCTLIDDIGVNDMRNMVLFADTWSHCEILWDRRYAMWALCAVTDDDTEVGKREYFTVQAHAIADAHAYQESGRCQRVDVYTKWGKLSKRAA